MNKNLLIPGLILSATVITGALSSGKLVAAHGLVLKDSDLSQELASKLNVNEDQVKSAFNSIKEERQAEREAVISANLDRAIADGVITAEQKQQIIDKENEFQAKQEQLKQEREDWLKSNGIDEEKLEDYDIGLGFGHHRPGRDHLKMMGM